MFPSITKYTHAYTSDAWTGEVHFCAPAFSCDFDDQKRIPSLSHNFHRLQVFKRLLLLPCHKEGSVFGLKTKKTRDAIRASPVQDSRRGCCLCQSSFKLDILRTWEPAKKQKGQKTDPPGGTTFGLGDPLLDIFWNTFALHKGPKLGPRPSESDASLGGCLMSLSNTLLNRVTSASNKEVPASKKYRFQVPKANFLDMARCKTSARTGRWSRNSSSWSSRTKSC